MKDPIKIYDARWLTDEFADSEIKRLFEAAFLYAALLNIDTINITRDVRLGTARVMDIAIETALRAGLRVYACFDSFSTPLSYYTTALTTLKHPGTMGLTITASHNPKEYIGVKFTVPEMQAIGYNCGPLGGLKKVKELYHSPFNLDKKNGGELIIMEHPMEEYIQYSLKNAHVGEGSLRGLTVVLDALNGAAGAEIMRALTLTGVKVIPHRIIPNGDFPSGSPNPTSQNKMDETLKIAAQQNADVVIGLDGDGDRIVFGDKHGLFNAGFVMIPILETLLKSRNKNAATKVLYDPKVNPLALKQWGALNVQPLLFRNGHSQIKGYMKQVDALSGAEESGHFYHRLRIDSLNISVENSLLTILLFLNSLKQDKHILRELRDMQEQVFTSGEFNYLFDSDEIRDEALAKLIADFKGDRAKISSQSADGIELQGYVLYKGVDINDQGINLKNGWYSGYFRVATNEKGVVRSYISTADKEQGEKLVYEVRQILEKEFSGRVID